MHRSPTVPACLLLALLALFAGTAHATTIYRCTDAKGNVTMQNDTPCPAGSKQEVRQIGELPTAPAPVGKPVAAPVANVPPPGSSFELVRGPVTDPLPDTKVAAADRKPPPPLYECKTWEALTYLSETDTPEPRCVLMNTVGLNGDPNLGAGEACEVKQDTCTPLTDAALCSAWRRRIDEAKFRMTFAADADKATRKAEYERQLASFVDSTCR
jgi:hypothetical protein